MNKSMINIEKLNKILENHEIITYSGFLKQRKIIITFQKTDSTKIFNKEFVFKNAYQYKNFLNKVKRSYYGSN